MFKENRSKTGMVLLFFIILLSSCAQVQVSQDYDPGFIFSLAKSFNWRNNMPMPDSSGQGDNELLHKRFIGAIENNFLRRGLLITAKPDLLIDYNYTVKDKLESDPFTSGVGFGYGSYGRYGGLGVQSGSNIRQYSQGILVISIYSGATNELVWRGVGTREVFTHSSPETVTKAIYETVESIMKQFPPGK